MAKKGGPQSNYGRGGQKGPGDEVRSNEFSGLDPNDLPQVGDWVIKKTRAHELIEVRPSPSKPDTVSYRAIIRELSDVPPRAKTYRAYALIQDRLG
jgi:hypothetical protein